METRYTVRQASEMTGVKPYVVRYWEDELDLHIQRNGLGHHYTRYDIQLFLNIKRTERQGCSFGRLGSIPPGLALARLQALLTVRYAFGRAVSVNEECRHRGSCIFCVRVGAAEETVNPKILEFQTILERLITQEIQSQNEDEEISFS